MQFRYYLAASAAALSLSVTMVPAAHAQQITSGIEGNVTNTDGSAINGANVVVEDTRTGSQRSSITDGSGSFSTSSLVPGGPYTITVTAPGYEGQTVQDVFINIQGSTSFTFELNTAATASSDQTIVVTAQRANVQQLAVGPGTAFGAETLEDFPSISRDIRDIIRIDPRVSIERSDDGVDRISCLGGNDRSNTFTVDGIVQSDVFGLNGTPFGSRNSLPLPFDVIRETSVEFAPFDVEYSDFTGCLINVVTKSGENKFHGSAFFTYFDQGLYADEIDGLPLNAGEEKRYGATLGGPIIPDRLFFYAGYEQAELSEGNNFGPTGAGFTNEANFVTQDQFNQFAQIAQQVYGQDVGGYPAQLPEGNKRYFGRIDAYITDGQRLEASYQRLEETNVESDFGGQNLTGLNSFEDEGTISDYYSVRLYSDWTDRFSTEIRLSRAEVGDIQGPVGGGEAQSDNPLVRLAVGVPGAPGGRNGILSTGPGIFRSANQLDTKIDQAKFLARLDAGDHQLKFGAELNDLNVFNLFAVNATGTLYFSNLADFQEGLLSDGTSFFPNADQVVAGTAYGADINATPSGDINEAAATFTRSIFSVYAQDDWQATPQLSLTTGLRVQWTDGDRPTANPQFLARYGFTNAVPFSKLDPLILPRFAATYDFDNQGFFSDTRVTAGAGIFSGGDPVVYFSNGFSNNGFSTGLGTLVGCNTPNDGEQLDVVMNGQFTGFPQCVTDAGSAQAAAGLADTQSTDPDFKSPSVLRINAGIDTDFSIAGGFFSDWNLKADYIYSRFLDPLNFVDLAQVPNPALGINGFTVDGRPIYRAIDPTAAGCSANLVGTGGTPPSYTNVTAACFATGRDDEIQLTNGPNYDSHNASVALTKRFNKGLITDGGSVLFRLGYAFNDSSDFRNNGSSTATSSFDVTGAFDRQAPAISTALTETRHNFTAALSFDEQFFDGYSTKLGVFFRAREGRPYSLTFQGGSVFNDSSSGNGNALIYVPTGANDPNIDPASAANAQSLLNYLGTTNCDFTPGQSIERNSCRNPWHYDVDLRISQELPFLGSLTGVVEDRVEVFADFFNFLNLLDSSANILRSRGGFSGLDDIVAGGIDSQGRYTIGAVNPGPETLSIDSSAWRIQIGARYEF